LKRVLTFFCALGLGAPAVAQPYVVPASSVTWRAPAECGDGAELRRRIGGYLDHAMSPGPFADIEVARSDDGTYRATLAIHANGATATREVEGKDCAQVIDAVALVLGLAAQAPAATVTSGDDDALARPPPPPVGRTLALRVRGAADLGSIPGGGLGADAGLALTRGRLAVIASARWFAPRFATVRDTPGSGVDVSMRGGAAEACLHVTGAWACAGGELASIDGDPHVIDPHASRSTWAAITAGLAGDIVLGARARVVLELGGYFAAQRPRYILDNGEEIYEPSLVGARVYAGIEATIF
jgi:hypothetical protein